MNRLTEYLSKFSEDGYLYGKLVLFKNNEQIFVNHAKLDIYTGEFYSKAELIKYLQLLSTECNQRSFKNIRGKCEFKSTEFARIEYPFVFILYDILDFHKITGFVKFDKVINITMDEYYSNDLQQVKLIPVVKDGVKFEFSNEI